MFKAWQLYSRQFRRALARLGLALLPALAIFGPLFMTGIFGLAPEGRQQHLVKTGVYMLWLAAFFLVVIATDLYERIEVLEKKAGIRK